MKIFNSAALSMLFLASAVPSAFAQFRAVEGASSVIAPESIRSPSTASASGYDIFHIYVAGPNGGEIEVDGPSEMPSGETICGVRWTNPVAWYWAEGDYSDLGPLDIWNNGVDVNQLWFTGPYEGCSQDPYLFSTPVTPSGWPPEGAISLVVQVNPNNVEWLDAHGNVIPEPPEGEPDPETPSPCAIAPEFCEGPQDLQNPHLPTDPLGSSTEPVVPPAILRSPRIRQR